MANVTQKIPTFLGGVSRKPDFDKTPGQLVEANNAYPDEVYGMVKRPGTEWMGNLGITADVAKNTYFFPILREGRPRYLCGIRSGEIKIWFLDDPSIAITVNATSSALSYLNYNNVNGILENDAYRAASDDRRTVIVNRTVECKEDTTKWSSAPKPFVWTNRKKNRDANSIEDLPDGRVVRVHVTGGGNGSGELRPGVHYLPVTVNKEDNNGDPINTEGFGCVIKCTIGDNGNIEDVEDCELWASGSGYPDQCPASIDGVPGSRVTLATGMQPGEVYRVVNSGASDDDFYMQPFSNTSEADDTPGIVPGNRARIDGPYFWKECPSPDSYVGLQANTLPHELIQVSDTEFTFKVLDYSKRWAGDTVNNPAPSFVDHYINNVFFLNNRLGYLCEDNVILSRPINYGPPGSQPQEYVPDDNPWILRNYTEIDFFRQSAIGLTPADPIDMKAANNNTSIFHTVISTPQGVILFADGQQSLLYQPEGLLSPLSASITSLSNYDMTGDVEAVIVGETYYFVNKSDQFCKIYSMINQGMQNPPVIEDVTKSVADWLPNDITDLVACPTDSMIFAFNRTRRVVYCRRTIDRASSWTKWTLPKAIINMVVDHDLVYFLTDSDTESTISRARLYVLPDDYSLNPPEDTVEQSAQLIQTRDATTPNCPELYKYYRYVGQLDNPNNPVYEPGAYGDNIGNFIDETGKIETPWQTMDGTRAPYVGGPTFFGFWSTSTTYEQWKPGWRLTTEEGGQTGRWTDSNGKVTSWTVERPWLANMRVETQGYEDTHFFVGSTGLFNTQTNEQYSANPGAQSGGLFPVPPFRLKVSDPGVVTINGKWQFSNDGSTVLAEWDGVSDCRQNVSQHCGPNPPTGYERVRYVGKFSANSDSAWMKLRNQGEEVDSVTTEWFEFDPGFPNEINDYKGPPYIFVGGMWACLGLGVCDYQVFDNIANYVDDAFDEYTYWENYGNVYTDPPDGGCFGTVCTTGNWGVPWRSKVRFKTNGNFNPGRVYGSLGGQGFLNVDSVPTPYITNGFGNDHFVCVHGDGDGKYSQIDGYWEFEYADGTRVIWYGYDADGSLRTEGCDVKFDGLIYDPYIDIYTEPVSVTGNIITPPAGYPILDGVPMVYLFTNLPGQTPINSDRIGFTGSITVDDDGNLVADQYIEGFQGTLVIGYRYNYQIIVPNLFLDQGEANLDYTASLTVSRIKFGLGFSGTVDFDIQIKNQDWEKAYSQIISNDYYTSTAPLKEPHVVQVPVHKRNTDFRIQVSSDSPFPLSLDSCMWEGNYSPRYYRRV